MEWPRYQRGGNRLQRRATQGYESYPGYAAEGTYAYEQSMPYSPTQYVSNPLLAAYAVPPALPRLVDSRANRPKQYRETYGRRITNFNRDVSPPGRLRTPIEPRLRSSNIVINNSVINNAQHDSGFDDGADPSDDDDFDGADPNDDDDFDDRGETGLEFRREHAHPAEPSPYIETVERIHHSRFHGSTLDQDAVTAHLITEPQCEGSQSATATLFEWIHLETTTQSFASFMRRVSTLLLETRYKPDQVSLLLSEVRRKFEHQIPTSGNTKGKYLEPTVVSTEPSSSRPKGKTRSCIQFLCIPYFLLKQLPTHPLSITSDVHPTRTLLQTQYPSTSAKRDMQQVVCQLDYTRKRHCFHVPQLWCLMIDDGLLITSGPMSKDEARQQAADLTVNSAVDAISRYLHVSDASGRRWLLPLSGCQSWTEFIAHFSNTDEEFDQTYDVIYKQSIQRPKDWVSLIAIAREQNVRLRIRFRRKGRGHGISLRASIHRYYSEGQSDSSSSGARRPKLDSAIKEKDDTFSDAVARPPPASIDFKEVAPVDQQSRDMTEKHVMNPQDHMPVERQTQWSIKPSQLGDNTSMSVSRETFHLCYWLSAAPAQSTDAITVENDTPSAATNPVPEQNTTTFDVDLTKINKYIIELTAHIEQTLNPSFNPHARQYPVDCMPRGLAEVQTRLAEIKNSCDTTTNSQSWPSADSHGRRGRAWAENRSDVQDLPASHWDGRDSEQSQKMHCQKIFRLAKQVYQFLLPLRGSSLESWVTTKFWGAIYWYIENPKAEGTKCILDYAIRHDLKGKLCAIAEDLQYGPRPGTIQIPDEFCQVGHHLIAIFLWGTCKKPRKLLSSRFQTCQNLLVDGRRRLLHRMAPENLDTMEAVLPVGIAALLVNRLMKDITEDAPDIVSTYYDYMLRLEQDVQKRPHRRVHQEKLSSFRQETNCIVRVLEDQIGVVSQLQQMLDKGGDTNSALGRRREDFILGGCLTTLEDRISNINSLERHARDLASYNLLRIESSKDRQEAAILVFTIVTIIFLPLSFVSSFFGMNTTDIRDTKFPQWIFWVSAVPLTVLVVILSLFVAQKMEPLKDLWSRVQDKWIAHREAPVEYYINRRPTGDLRADSQDMEPPNLPENRVRGDETDGIQLRAGRHPNRFVSP